MSIIYFWGKITSVKNIIIPFFKKNKIIIPLLKIK